MGNRQERPRFSEEEQAAYDLRSGLTADEILEVRRAAERQGKEFWENFRRGRDIDTALWLQEKTFENTAVESCSHTICPYPYEDSCKVRLINLTVRYHKEEKENPNLQGRLIYYPIDV